MLKDSKTKLQQLVLILGVFFIAPATMLAQVQPAQVCQTGNTMPPFLDAGVDPNLLMVLDNSGSMLDMAYLNENPVTSGTYNFTDTGCYDDSYTPWGTEGSYVPYVGIYNPEQWYKYVAAEAYSTWQSGVDYEAGSIVRENNNLYTNEFAGTSTTDSPSSGLDVDLNWTLFGNTIPTWKSSENYPANTVVQENDVYYTNPTAGTSSGASLITDTILWVELDITSVNVTWEPETVYPAMTWVWHAGTAYYTALGGTSGDDDSITDLAGDSGVTDWIVASPNLYYSYQGLLYYSSSSGMALQEGFFQEIDEADVIAHCQSGLSIGINGIGGSAAVYGSLADDVCAARASTTAIDDTIDPYLVTAFAARGNFLNWVASSKFDIEKTILTGGKYNLETNMLIGEHRGCSGSRFIKYYDLADGSNIILAVDGPSDDASLNDTTRIAILAVGGQAVNLEACHEIVWMMENDPQLGGPDGLKGLMDQCFLYSSDDGSDNPLADQIPTFNHAMQNCWYLAEHEVWHPGNGPAQRAEECAALYENGQPSVTINPWDYAYVCYGLYDDSEADTARLGYVGRCWEPESIPDGCRYVICNETGHPASPQATSAPYHDSFCGDDQKIYDCDGNFNANQGACNGGSFKPRVTDAVAGSGLCDEDGDRDPGFWTDDENPHDADECIDQALKDYCGYLQVPEVIDPSNETAETSEFWNIPGALIDSGIITQLGTERPLLTMKGILYHPEEPEGILDEVNELFEVRMGVMAFNDNGALEECPDVVDPTATVQPFCSPQQEGAELRDGAQVITPIQNLDYVYEDENIDHFSKMVMAINDTRATTWTPLAEAVFNALGYYGQNAYFQLDADDFPLDADPVEAYCQENHILIITEGASTKDIRSEVATFINDTGTTSHNIDFDTDSDRNCEDSLQGSTYLDDMVFFGQTATVTGDDSGASNLYTTLLPTDLPDPDPPYEKQPITTHFITTGSLERNDASGECSSEILMEESAANGNLATPDDQDPLIRGENPQLLETRLREFFNNLLTRSSSGSAASVIASSRSGEGAIFQAVFWPEVLHENDGGTLDWVGDVHSFNVDDKGYLWDDANINDTDGSGSGTLWSEDEDGDGYRSDEQVDEGITCLDGDRRTHFYFDGDKTRVCFTEPVWSTACEAINPDEPEICQKYCLESDYCDSALASLTGEDYSAVEFTNTTMKSNDDALTGSDSSVTGIQPVEGILIQEFDNYLWSARSGLDETALSAMSTNREFPYTNSALIDYPYGRWDWEDDDLLNQRYIFTWNDLNNDGIVDSSYDNSGTDEIIPLVSEDIAYWTAKNAAHNSNNIYGDFGVGDYSELSNLIEWLRGTDIHEDVNRNGVIDNITNTDGDIIGTEDVNGNGVLEYLYRCRKYPDCYEVDTAGNPTAIPSLDQVWRLGDIVHSTPTMVAQPAEAFHTIYRDGTYAYFVKRHRYRRNMVYFGANDGMLHAVNAGFPLHTEELLPEDEIHKIWKFLDIDTTNGEPCYYDDTTSTSSYPEGCVGNGNYYGPELGREMWAYIPYNQQIHLLCQTDPEYSGDRHKFYVDKEPRIFDMQIFEEEGACNGGDTPYDSDCIHPGGWGTILVGAMRFGGAPVEMADGRTFISSYFILDITDPERPPQLLGEFTMTDGSILDTNGNPVGAIFDNNDVPIMDEVNNAVPETVVDLGFSTPMVTGAVMRDNTGETMWYLVLGNGPTTLKGENTESGKVAILPMSWLTGVTWSNIDTNYEPTIDFANRRAIRIPDRTPSSDISDLNGAGVFRIEDSVITNINDPDDSTDDTTTTFDDSFLSDLITLDLDLQTQVIPDIGGLYKSDAVYFGTTDGASVGPDFIPVESGNPNDTQWNGGGRVFRLVLRDKETSTSSDNYGYQRVTYPWDWHLEKLIDPGQPVTGAPSAGWDGSNYWIYFGTGRFFAPEDSTDPQTHHFFGIKEPVRSDDCEMTWAEVEWDKDSWYSRLAPSATAGSRGLFRSDYVVVPEAPNATSAIVFCDSEAPANSCLLGDFLCPQDDPSTAEIEEGALCRARDDKLFEDLRTYIEGESRDLTAGTCFQGDPDGDDGPEVGPSTGIDGFFIQLKGDRYQLAAGEEGGERERIIGQSTLIGGLSTFASYQPSGENLCNPGGNSYLYGVHYQTGTAWYENVFGLYTRSGGSEGGSYTAVRDVYNLGTGMATTPSIHTGQGSSADAKAFIQTSTGEIVEIDQENLPLEPPKSGRILWTDQSDD